MSESDFENVTLQFPGVDRVFNIKAHKRSLSMINEIVEVVKRKYLAAIEQCESPIEQMMAIALEVENERKEWLWNQWGLNVVIVPRSVVGQYRVDFLVDVVDSDLDRIVALIVECDGHDFHEKTKEQAAKDKTRDRYLHSLDLTVLRFTGSEVWNDPHKCAKEAIDILTSMVRNRKFKR